MIKSELNLMIELHRTTERTTNYNCRELQNYEGSRVFNSRKKDTFNISKIKTLLPIYLFILILVYLFQSLNILFEFS